MNARPRKVDDADSELARLHDEAERRPVDLEKDGVRYRVMRVPADGPSIPSRSEQFSRERVIEAIHASAGSLKNVDTDALLRTLYEDRIQDSNGRPAQ